MTNQYTASISSKAPADPAFDYEALRKQGIGLLEETCSGIWTDYNVHDPGITTLEILCYALTDLSHRANYSIPDLLARDITEASSAAKQFFSAATILPNQAVTINDYRKLVIDIEGVQNAWIEQARQRVFADVSRKRLMKTQPETTRWEVVDISGYYTVLLEYDPNVAQGAQAGIRSAAMQKLMSNRNLCEDFISIQEVGKQEFRLCATLELAPGIDPFDCLASMFFNIQLLLTPLLRFYTIDELLADGFSPDEIFEGPRLAHGFLKTEELEQSDLRSEIHLSDVMQQMLNTEGLKNILEIIFNPADQLEASGNKWIIPVARGHQPRVSVLASNVLIYKNGLPFRPDMNVVNSRFQTKLDNYITRNDQVRTGDIPIDPGAFADPGNYYSIQNHFPKTYGISHWGLPDDASPLRIAQAKQLQGYLYFFDQHLANALSQLANFGALISTEDTEHTYFSQVVDTFKDPAALFNNIGTLADDLQTAAERTAEFHQRRNLFLDHLLARYAESFNEYVDVLSTASAANTKDVISPSIVSQEDIIADKTRFLRNYPEYSSQRFSAFNYRASDKLWDTDNISGLEKRLESLLGFDVAKRRSLVNVITRIQEGVNASDNKEYWYEISDARTGQVLLAGIDRFNAEELARFNLEDVLGLIYNPMNSKILSSDTGEFSYQVLNATTVLGQSVETYADAALAARAFQHLVTLITKGRAEEGLFLLEHLLLVPSLMAPAPASPVEAPSSPPEGYDGFLPICVDENCRNCEDKDPYSFRISIIMPAYAPRFLNINFRNYCERTIRMEAPAHTFVKICWVSNEQLAEFEQAYKEWLPVKAATINDDGNIRLQKLVTILSRLRSIYPVSRLEDCSNQEERTLFMLNQNSLGTLKT